MKTCKTPCAECPFRRDSRPGYLGGGYTVETFVDQHIRGDGLNPCHMTVDTEAADWHETFIAGDNGSACKGQAVFYTNQCKQPRPGSLIVTSVFPDVDAVFTWVAEFTEHHGKVTP